MLNRASSSTEVLHCVLKSSAQAVPQTPEVNACLKSPFTVIHSWSWSWSCLGNPLLRKGSFGLLLRQRKHFFSPPPQESNTQHIAVKLPKSPSQTTERRGAAVPSPALQAPEEMYPIPEGVCRIHNNICHLQGVPKPADVGQSAVLMEFSFLPAESAPLCMELIKYS